ncbi:MAG TPA: hypothetical protein VF207_04620, partial [Chthoniobacterales bacterium]
DRPQVVKGFKLASSSACYVKLGAMSRNSNGYHLPRIWGVASNALQPFPVRRSVFTVHSIASRVNRFSSSVVGSEFAGL